MHSAAAPVLSFAAVRRKAARSPNCGLAAMSVSCRSSRSAWPDHRTVWLTSLLLALPATLGIAEDRPSRDASHTAVQAAPDARQPISPDDREAQRLLDAARHDAERGRAADARRGLETLIGRHPESRAAADARRDLFALYSTDRTVAGDRTIPPTPRPAQRPSTLSEAPQPAATTAEPASERPVTLLRADSGWRTSMITFRRLQDDLRHAVGDRVFFSAGSADIGARARNVITAQAEWLRQRPDVTIVVEGHADDRLSGGDDELLSLQRASVVREVLVESGLEAERIRLEPHGGREPIAPCADSACSAQNRRAVLRIGVRQSHDGINLRPASSHGAAGEAGRR